MQPTRSSHAFEPDEAVVEAAPARSIELLPETRQCAWCLLVVDGSGRYRTRSAKVPSATHGICPACKQAFLAQIDPELEHVPPFNQIAS